MTNELPIQYRLELSDDVNLAALDLLRAIDAMSLAELKKLQRKLSKLLPPRGRPDVEKMTVALAGIGLSYVVAMDNARRQRQRDVAAAGVGEHLQEATNI